MEIIIFMLNLIQQLTNSYDPEFIQSREIWGRAFLDFAGGTIIGSFAGFCSYTTRELHRIYKDNKTNRSIYQDY